MEALSLHSYVEWRTLAKAEKPLCANYESFTRRHPKLLQLASLFTHKHTLTGDLSSSQG